MKIILMGEPMGVFMANETGSLSEVNGFTACGGGPGTAGSHPGLLHPPGL